MEKKPILWIVIPCYNEEKVLPITAPLFNTIINGLINDNKVSKESKILFVNDGSSDNTWNIIKDLSNSNEHYIGISQSRNRGHQNAVLAGLMEAKDVCDITISIDCDGQDDISAINEMVDEYLNGSEIVYGVRKKRDTDTFFKRFTAEVFYRLLEMFGVEVVFNHADYRLISSRVLQEFANYKEVNLFLRGMVPLVGFPSSKVYYDRAERIAGESHYPLSKMIQLAINGITSLSVKPIRLIFSAGVILSLIGFIGLIWGILASIKSYSISVFPAIWAVFFVGGINLTSIGIIGEYIGKIYMESKERPRYIISEKTWEPYNRKYKG